MRLFLSFAILLLFQSFASAVELSGEDVVRAAINRTFPDLEVSSVKKSPVSGLYEVVLGPELVYASADGRYIVQGDLIDLKQKVNVTEAKRSGLRQDLLARIPAAEYIEFAPAQPLHTIYVFTDIDCGYCRRLHADMPELNKLGIAVRYLAFPRAGVGSKTYKQMESVWCAANRQKAMNEAKQGMRVSKKNCENPVEKQFLLGQDIGVRGTPAIYTKKGKSLPGYMPPDKLLQALLSQ